MNACFLMVLHAHLPFVVNHGRWPHGSEWLAEIATHCYLPLLKTLRTLRSDQVPVRLTVNLSPVLCEQLASPPFQTELAGFLADRRAFCSEDERCFRDTRRADLAALARSWDEFYGEMDELLRSLRGDILSGFRELRDGGVVEVITSAATHGYLPLLSRDESVRLQISTAVATHQKHFGAAPEGIWLPECAYRPGYRWTPPVGTSRARTQYLRPGLEEHLDQEGLRFFVTDTHLLQGGPPLSIYRGMTPPADPRGGVEQVARRRSVSPYEVYRVGPGPVAVYTRDPRTTLVVWSRDSGYPGDGVYLEFHKRHTPGGMRYWRVTAPGRGLGEKDPYDPEAARTRAREHARHFADLVQETLEGHHARTGRAGGLCASYDAELFGHWWFEGPIWLDQVFRELAARKIPVASCGERIEQAPPRESIRLLEGSWGAGGDHRVWLNEQTEWTWDRIYDAEEEMWRLSSAWEEARPSGPADRVLRQAAREFLLLQASDWQFLITMQSARDYAELRFAEHYATFKQFVRLARKVLEAGSLTAEEEGYLSRMERQDFLFGADSLLHTAPERRPGAAA